MVNVVLNKINNQIKQISIEGHANFLEYGKDIVCAAITGIVGGALNAVDQMFKNNEVKLTVSQNKICFKVNDLENKDLQQVLNFMIIQLQTIQVQYDKNLQIKEI